MLKILMTDAHHQKFVEIDSKKSNEFAAVNFDKIFMDYAFIFYLNYILIAVVFKISQISILTETISLLNFLKILCVRKLLSNVICNKRIVLSCICHCQSCRNFMLLFRGINIKATENLF